MKRASATTGFLQFLATTDTAAMSTRSSSYRGGRYQWRRGYSGGRGQQFVTGDSHFRSVQEANSGIRQSPGDRGGRSFNNPRLQTYNHPNQQFRRPPPPFNPRPSPRQQARPKPMDYRDWQYAKKAPSHVNSGKKFIVLSYNILADYLAMNHRRKLYFHIPHHMLDWEWRKRSILFELGLWSADIMCFQEVDRFQDLVEELKPRGYSGIWKMRTGDAVDGCAIFWRTSRFKLLHEESIEFNRLGLRDNVAQICVLELTSNNCTSNTSAMPASSASSDKVVICNIHVLYNPKRGEIKLGQVRTLLSRAYAVSKTWNAPIVICGDFNCTPKSPLYNFISEQKIDLSGIDRDKVSGQASAEIRVCSSDYNPNPNLNSRIHSSDNSVQAPDNSFLDMQKQNNPDRDEETIHSNNDCFQPQVIRTMLDASDISCTVVQSGSDDSSICIGQTKETQEDVIDISKEGTESTMSNLIDRFEENLTISCSESESKPICNSAAIVNSRSEETYLDKNEIEQRESARTPSQRFVCENSHSNISKENEGSCIDNLAQSLDENSDLSPACQGNISSGSISLNCEGDETLEDASLPELNDFKLEGGMIGEDQSTFLSALHDKEDCFGTDSGPIRKSDLDHSQNDYNSDPIDPEVHSTGNEVLDDVPLDLDSEAVAVEKTAYDPSLWTPMEIATATGNADCTFVEHPLKLKSTYAEVEDCSGTRDPNGEPLVTSYNRCFFGTVDYIWSSEGLQTIRVLATLPKHAMQWTAGFPTKKWGSDHIALASELAFTNDAIDVNVEVQ